MKVDITASLQVEVKGYGKAGYGFRIYRRGVLVDYSIIYFKTEALALENARDVIRRIHS